MKRIRSSILASLEDAIGKGTRSAGPRHSYIFMSFMSFMSFFIGIFDLALLFRASSGGISLPAVCQCQGILHPAGVFARITDEPFDGSPFCTETFKQVGSPGRFMNFGAELAAGAILSSAHVDWVAGPATRTAKIKLQAARRM